MRLIAMLIFSAAPKMLAHWSHIIYVVVDTPAVEQDGGDDGEDVDFGKKKKKKKKKAFDIDAAEVSVLLYVCAGAL